MNSYELSELRKYRNLWAKVLLKVHTDLCLPWGGPEHDRQPNRESIDARIWIGNYPTRDFREICDLANVDSDGAFEKLRAMCNMSEQELKEERRRLVIDLDEEREGREKYFSRRAIHDGRKSA